MKIYISNYPDRSFFKRWIHTILSKFFKKNVTIFNTPIRYIHIDNYDIWNLDETLSHVIVACLKKIKGNKSGAPFVDNADVPESLYMPESWPVDRGEVDKNWFQRWDYVLNEMIWSFEQNSKDWEADFCHTKQYWATEEYKYHVRRMENGRNLFAKYYNNLWT
jgi:hypothetical protein